MKKRIIPKKVYVMMSNFGYMPELRLVKKGLGAIKYIDNRDVKKLKLRIKHLEFLLDCYKDEYGDLK